MKYSFQRERSDRQYERDRDRRGARTILRDSQHEWKSDRGTNKFDIPGLLAIHKMLKIYVRALWFHHSAPF